MIPKLIWRNLWRNKRRTLITATSVVFAVFLAIVMKSLQDGAFSHLLDGIVRSYSGHLQVHKAGYWDEPVIENAFTDRVPLRLALEKADGISAMVPRLETFVLVAADSITKGAMLLGIDAEREEALMRIREKTVSGAPLTVASKGLVVAEGLAARLGVAVGDTLVLLGQGYHGATAAGKYPVEGLLHFGAPQLNDNLLCLSLPVAQDLMGAPGLVTSWAVSIADADELDALRSTLAARTGADHEVLTWKQQIPDVERHIRMDGISFYIWTGILYLIIGFGIFSTILMMVTERKYEFGMLLAIGMGRMKLAFMVMLETMLLSVLGALAGALISLPVVWYLQVHPIRFTGEFGEAYKRFGFEPVLPAIIDPWIFLQQTLIVLSIALIIGSYPLLRIGRLNALNAMKR